MANEERARILQMVAAGQITPAEAEDLLSALDPTPTPRPPVPPLPPLPLQTRPNTARSLTIQVIEGEQSKVNVRIPLSLARAAARFIPRQAHAYLNQHEINLDDLLESLHNSEEEHTLLEVHDGNAHVRIAIE